MTVRFNPWSDETWCGAEVGHGKLLGPFVCTRRSGHDGAHIAMVRDAAEADGVCFECRELIGAPHRKECGR